MNNICSICKEGNAVTDCDKCGKRTCRACSQLLVIKGDLAVMHKACVPKRYLKTPAS